MPNNESTSKRLCLWCGSPLAQSRSREHVVADWLAQKLNASKETVTAFVAQTFNEEIVLQREHDVDSMVEGRVCGSCNKGWMSDLENKVKPVLETLISMDRLVFSLNKDERSMVAKWAVKTAYMLSKSSNFEPRVEACHLKSFYEGSAQIPSGVSCFANHCNGSRFLSWVQENCWPTFSPEHDLPSHRGSYKIGLQFGALILVVAYWPHPGWSFLLGAGVHAPLWPQENIYFAYSVREPPPRSTDSYQTLRWFTRTIAVLDRNQHIPE
ncbi:MAG TPA: hypothetical protein VMV34_09240 [Terriglobia bacterium]|nr:hypothetical protein [Terriglobia bacterium]